MEYKIWKGKNLCHSRTSKKEDHEQHEGQIPRMNGVGNSRQHRSDATGWRQGLVRPGSIHYCHNDWPRNYSLHIEISNEEITQQVVLSCSKDEDSSK